MLGFIASGGPEGGDGELLMFSFWVFSNSTCIIIFKKFINKKLRNNNMVYAEFTSQLTVLL